MNRLYISGISFIRSKSFLTACPLLRRYTYEPGGLEFTKRLYCTHDGNVLPTQRSSSNFPLHENLNLDKMNLSENEYFKSLLLSNSDYKRFKLSKEAAAACEELSVMSENISGFSKEDLVAFMYNCNVARSLPKDLAASNDFQQKLTHIIPNCSLEELAVICLGLFKTQNPVPEAQTHVVAHTLTSATPSTSSYVISALVKALRLSTHRYSVRSDPAFGSAAFNALQNLSDVIHEQPPQVVSTIFHFYASIRLISAKFFANLSRYVIEHSEELSKWRLKDIERILFFLGFLSHRRTDVIDLLLTEVKQPARRSEILAYPHCLLGLLDGLSYIAIYDEELTRFVFTPDFVAALLEKQSNDYTRSLYSLHEHVRLERPQYLNGRTADTILGKEALEKLYSWVDESNNESTRIRLLEKVREVVMFTLHSYHVYARRLLPYHHDSDILVQLDERLRPMDLTSDNMFAQVKRRHVPKTIAKPIRIAFVVYSPTSYYTYYDEHQRRLRGQLGMHTSKARLLTALGYLVVEIPFFKFTKVRRKNAYIEDKLKTVLKKLVV